MNDDSNVEVLESTSELENLSYEDNNSFNYNNTPETNNNDNFTHNTNNEKVPKYRGFRIRLFEYLAGLAFSLIFIGMSIFGYNYYSKEQASYTEQSSINYQICLKENEYYGERCLSENNEYVSALTNSIRATFNYSKVYDFRRSWLKMSARRFPLTAEFDAIQVTLAVLHPCTDPDWK